MLKGDDVPAGFGGGDGVVAVFGGDDAVAERLPLSDPNKGLFGCAFGALYLGASTAESGVSIFIASVFAADADAPASSETP